MKKTILFLATLLVFNQSCKKTNTCSEGEVCIKNASNRMVHYAIGTDQYTDSIYPGQSSCFKIGKIKTRPWGGKSEIVSLYSDHGDYYFEVTSCHHVETLN